MKFKTSILLLLVALGGLPLPALAHDPVLSDPKEPFLSPEELLPGNYLITFTLQADGTKQEAELITARRTINFDLVDDPDHSLRFKGQLKVGDDKQITLSYTAMLITMVTNAADAKEVATTSGEGAIIMQFNRPMTLVRSKRQQLAVSIRPIPPEPSPVASSTPVPAR